jgi:putative ABC transport system ATP-binding protein
MLKVDNIRKTFSHRHGKVSALSDINIEIADGEFLSITGPSGSGKSTLLLALGGMSSPNDGKVLWNNESIFDWELKQRAQWRAKTVGFVFQTFNLIPYLTVYENVSLAMDLSDPQSDRNETILSILDRMKLSNRLDHLPSELSIGQQQRVALARALVKDPQVILADEPTGNLDPETAEEILTIFKEINHEGKTVVLITHDPRIAQMTKRNVRIVDGRIAS